MSIKITQKVWQAADRLRGNDMLLLLALADYANDQGECWPSVRTLAGRTGLSERTVYRILARAARAGYIIVIPGGGKGRSNRYKLMLEVLRGHQPPKQVHRPIANHSEQTLTEGQGKASSNPDNTDRVCNSQTLTIVTTNPDNTDTQTLTAVSGKPSNINRQNNRQDINPPYPPQQAVRATTSSHRQTAQPVACPSRDGARAQRWQAALATSDRAVPLRAITPHPPQTPRHPSPSPWDA